MKSVINIACWSVGQHAIRNILPAINSHDQLHLVGCYTRNAIRLKEIKNTYNCKGFEDSNSLLNDSNIDVVYISSPTGVHYEQVLACLKHNKSVLIEKSAFTDYEETCLISKIARSKGLVVMEAFMYRFHQQFKDLIALLKSKKYGEVARVESSFCFPHLDFDNIRYDKTLGGGALNDAGAYTISSLLELLDLDIKPEWSSIYNDDSYNVDTRGLAVLKDCNSTIGIATWSFGLSYKNQITIHLDNAIVYVERSFSKPSNFESNILIKQNGVVVEEIKSGKCNHFEEMLSYFKNVAIENIELELDRLKNQARIMQFIRTTV